MDQEIRYTDPKVYERYKEHWVCFHCRKMFKRPSWQTLRQQARDEHTNYTEYLKSGTAKCPECGQAMRNMGKGFRPPKQKELRQWKALEKVSGWFYGWRW